MLTQHVKEIGSSKPTMIVDKAPPPPDSEQNPPIYYTQRGSSSSPPSSPSTSAPPDVNPLKDDVLTENVSLDPQINSDGRLKLKFKSHGRQHSLDLVKYRQQFSDFPVKFAGANADKQQKIANKLKVSKLYY